MIDGPKVIGVLVEGPCWFVERESMIIQSSGLVEVKQCSLVDYQFELMCEGESVVVLAEGPCWFVERESSIFGSSSS
jgi:hypothetical protein